MPSKSQKQHDFMMLACKDKAFAKKANISQEVACEFIKEDEKEGLWQKKKKRVYQNWSKK